MHGDMVCEYKRRGLHNASKWVCRKSQSCGPWFCITGKNKPEATEAELDQAA